MKKLTHLKSIFHFSIEDTAALNLSSIRESPHNTAQSTGVLTNDNSIIYHSSKQAVSSTPISHKIHKTKGNKDEDIVSITEKKITKKECCSKSNLSKSANLLAIILDDDKIVYTYDNIRKKSRQILNRKLTVLTMK